MSYHQMTVAEAIRYLQQFDPEDRVSGTTVDPGGFQHPTVFRSADKVTPPGSSLKAVPLFTWYPEGAQPTVGDRVRVPGRRFTEPGGNNDIGTVTEVQPRKGYSAVMVTWDSTGKSNENSNLLGRAVEQ